MSLGIEFIDFSNTPQIGMMNCGKYSRGGAFPALRTPRARYPSPFHENANGNSLLNVKNVLVFRTIKGLFLLFAITMQIKDIQVIETLQQAASHAPEGRVIQVAMIGDEGQDSIICLLNVPLREAHELYIVVTQPFCLTRFLQFWTAFFICGYQRIDPLALVCRMSSVWWITKDYQ